MPVNPEREIPFSLASLFLAVMIFSDFFAEGDVGSRKEEKNGSQY
jgi:hypothetical protein